MNFTVNNFVAALCIYACCLATITMATCPKGNCPVAGYYFALGQNMVNNHALDGSVFERSTISSPVECYNKCRLNCRCISFNYLTTVSQDNCELNDESRYLKPIDLKPKEGSQYYDLVIYYNVKYNEGNNPYPGCQNGCCRSPSPCSSPGTLRCEETCDVNGKRFRCICKSDNWRGNLCDSRPLYQASSYMMFPNTDIQHKTQIIIRFKPAALNGLLFYGANTDELTDFLSIVLHNGFVKLRFDHGGGFGRVGEAKSSSIVILNTWYTVNASRIIRDGTLILNDDSPVSAVSPGHGIVLDVNSNFYLGVPNLFNLRSVTVDSAESTVPGFSGCIDYFEVNDVVYSLATGGALEEENISLCTDISD